MGNLKIKKEKLADLLKKKNAKVENLERLVQLAKAENRSMNDAEVAEFEEDDVEVRSYESQIVDLSNDIAREERMITIIANKEKINQSQNLGGAEFRDFMRYGQAERRAEASDPSDVTGIVLPATIIPSVEIAMKSYGGIISIANILNTANGNTINQPVFDNTNNNANSRTKMDKISEGNRKMSNIEIKAYSIASDVIPISEELIEDTSFNVETMLRDGLVDDIQYKLSQLIVNGTGANEIKGILSQINKSVEADAVSITYDNLVDLMQSVNARFKQRGTFVFNTKTETALMKLKDSDGKPIFSSNIEGMSNKILGHPYILDDSMPNIEASKSSILFGDFSKLTVRIVNNIKVKRLAEAYASYNAIGFLGVLRADAVIINAGLSPIAKLIHAAQ